MYQANKHRFFEQAIDQTFVMKLSKLSNVILAYVLLAQSDLIQANTIQTWNLGASITSDFDFAPSN